MGVSELEVGNAATHHCCVLPNVLCHLLSDNRMSATLVPLFDWTLSLMHKDSHEPKTELGFTQKQNALPHVLCVIVSNALHALFPEPHLKIAAPLSCNPPQGMDASVVLGNRPRLLLSPGAYSQHFLLTESFFY